MRIAVSAEGPGLAAHTSRLFGRCPYIVFVDTDSSAYESLLNDAQGASGGAGIQAAQTVVQHGAQAVVAGDVGPNAFDVLEAAGIAVYPYSSGTVEDAVAALRDGRLQGVPRETVADHSGLGAPSALAAPPALAAPSERDAEIARLRGEASALRKQLADLMDRIDRLTQGE